jgi:hypothetical protein
MNAYLETKARLSCGAGHPSNEVRLHGGTTSRATLALKRKILRKLTKRIRNNCSATEL